MKKGGAKIPLKFGQSFTDDRFRHLKPTRRFAIDPASAIATKAAIESIFSIVRYLRKLETVSGVYPKCGVGTIIPSKQLG
jgi:hypothetical protein